MTGVRQPPGAAGRSDDLDRVMERYRTCLTNLLPNGPPHQTMFAATVGPIFTAIRAEAVAAERERCAKIAENGCLVPPDGGSPTEDEANMCKNIADAIRSGREP